MEPLIWTTKGNIPISSLEYSFEWEDTENYVKFTETYKLDGEVVKCAPHILLKKTPEMNAITEI